MGVGSYGVSSTVAMRAGAQANATLELIHKDLLAAKGTAYTIERGSVVWAETYAWAKALCDLYEGAARMAANINPATSLQALDQWEQMLDIVPLPNATIPQRQAAIALHQLRWTKPPTINNIEFFLQNIMGNVFLGLEFYSNINNDGISFMLSGSFYIPWTDGYVSEGHWVSYISQILVRIWQPRDKYGNIIMDNATFQAVKNNFFSFLTGYLPAYSSYQALQFNTSGTGQVFGYLGADYLTGVGTNFTAITGNQLEVVDDSGNCQTLIIQSIMSDTYLTITNKLTTSITGSSDWRYYPGEGFRLDIPNNLDNMELT